MAITDIRTEWVNAWDDGWGAEQWPLIMNLDGPANVLAQITLVTYNPNDGSSRRQTRLTSRWETGTSALRSQRLAQPQVVAAWVANGSVPDAVGLVDGLLEDFDPGGAQRLEGLV
jgi:hypothetical protein